MIHRVIFAFVILASASLAAAQSVPAAPAAPEQKGTLAGTILNTVTGEPVVKALITLRRTAAGPVQMPPAPAFTTITDRAGKYAMKDIPAGTYQLSAQRTGFVNMQYGARGANRPGIPLTFAAGQSIKSADFKLIPHSVIAGRVRDEDGDPVSAAIAAMRYQFSQGRKQLTVAATATSNDLGEYRLFGLAPGRYYLTANASAGANEDHSAERPVLDNYVTTFYPDAPEFRVATAVDLSGGRQALAVDIRMARAKTVSVRGHAINATGATGVRTNYFLVPREQNGYFSILQPILGPQGQFEFRSLMPGQYTLMVSVGADGDLRPYTVRQVVDVGSQDVENLTVTVGKGIAVKGAVRIEGVQKFDLTNLRITLSQYQASLTTGQPPSARVGVDGDLLLEGVNSDIYSVNVTGLPAGFYIKSARLGDADVLEQPMDSTRGAAGDLAIVVASGAGEVNGSVLNAESKPVSAATVALVPDAEKRRTIQRFFRTATTDQAGKFTIKDADPGKYHIYAWEDLESGAYFDPDVIEAARGKGKPLEIREGDSLTAELTAVPAP